ncbi:MAG: FAD-dependent oxidoreductase [Pseudomonadota bacterium]
MSGVTLSINGRTIAARPDQTIVAAAGAADIYIPTLCHHPNLIPGRDAKPLPSIYQGDKQHRHHGDDQGQGCGLCLVEIEGEADLQPACAVIATAGLVVTTESERISAVRREKLAAILANHPHACLTCAQNEGCTRTQCSSNVSEAERCCPQLGRCQVQAVAKHVGLPGFTPRWVPTDLPILQGPLFTRDYNLCIGCTRCVRACQDLRGIGAIGFVRDEQGRAIIGSVAPTLEESGCKFCAACVEVCPTGALSDKNVRAGSREKDLVPCRAACPAGLDIPWYLRRIAAGEFDEAHSIIREKVPFPGILGRICIRPCEDACRRGEVNEPLAICALKRAAADRETGGWKAGSRRKPESSARVAVVGAGPAGLACAFYLRKAGRQVTVFDSESEPGGMLRWGIPEYRLPRDILDKEIKAIFDEGVGFEPGKIYGRHFTAASLREQGFQAVFLAPGARESRRIPLEGSDKSNVLWGLDFLREVRRGAPPALNGRVVVIGGGNVAIDVALTAKRLGASKVSLACLESREEMPAHEWECRGASAEGVEFLNSWGPAAVLGDRKVAGIRLKKCSRVFDEKNKFNPVFDETQTLDLEADVLILAVGQATAVQDFEAEPALKIQHGLIVVGEDQAASMPGVFAGGDAAAMPGSVIAAAAAGRKAASAMDKALGGDGLIEETLFERPEPEQFLGRTENFAFLKRETVGCVLPQGRDAFAETELGFETAQARAEAARCLQCDLRLTLSKAPFPPEKMTAFTPAAVAGVPEAEGVFILYDQDKKTLAIKGEMNLRRSLEEALENRTDVAFFEWEEDKMFSKRESELLAAYLQEHGQMPGGGADELDDLF